MAITIKLVILSCVVLLCVLNCVVCRRPDGWSKPCAAEEEPEASDITDADEEGHGRARLGWLTAPLPWLGVVWDSSISDNGSHGKLAGFSIHLKDGYMITQNITTKLLPNFARWKDPQPAQFTVPSPAKIDLAVGPSDERFDNTELVSTGLAGTPFDLHKIVPYKIAQSWQSLATSVLKTIERPNLELDVNEFGSNCSVYAYSELPNYLPSPYFEELGEDKFARFFVRLPVRKIGCIGIRCTFRMIHDRDGKICSGRRDHGIPVLCGAQNKLTYLVSPPWDEEDMPGCDPWFNAYHIPPIVESIKALNLGHIL